MAKSEDENRKKRVAWLDDETELLVQFYAEEIPQNPITGKYRKLNSYVSITERLKDVGYKRTAEQVRTKLKQLRREYYAARRGTDSDRQDCYMYDELDELFRNENLRPREGASEYYEKVESNQQNIDELVEETQQSSDISADYIPEQTLSPTSSKHQHEMNNTNRNHKSAKRSRTIYKDEISDDDDDEDENDFKKAHLMRFVNEQLDKQRHHQREITKTFTDAMTTQFTQFSNLITTLTQQMFAAQNRNLMQSNETVGNQSNIIVVDPFESGKIEANVEPETKRKKGFF